MANRGQLTPFLQELARSEMQMPSWDLTQTELRLMPYLQYELMNNKRIDPNKINAEERKVLSRWRELGWIAGGAGEDVTITAQFWDTINSLLYVAYVAYEEFE